MENTGRHSDLIPAYLNGTINPEARQELEQALAENPELQKELNELARICAGIVVYDGIALGHVDSEQLALFATEPDELDDGTREEITSHLATCDECSEEMRLCRDAAAAETVAREDRSRGWLAQVREFLFPPLFSLRPVFVYAAMGVLAVVVFVGVGEFGANGPTSARFEISPGAERSATGAVELDIPGSTEIVHLDLVLGTKENRIYTVELLGNDNIPDLVIPHKPHRFPIAISLPSVYLAEGRNALRVVEEVAEGAERIPDTIDIDIAVHFTKE